MSIVTNKASHTDFLSWGVKQTLSAEIDILLRIKPIGYPLFYALRNESIRHLVRTLSIAWLYSP